MDTYAVQKTARTWDSYKNPLLTVLHAFNPESILEYGPGESTKIFQAHPSIKIVDTIEHAPAWAEKIKGHLNIKTELHLEPKNYKYPYVTGRMCYYDLVFIDGIERPACISVAKFRTNRSSIIVVHDAKRIEYRQAMELWGLKYFTDEGNTVFMTNDLEVGDKLAEILL